MQPTSTLDFLNSLGTMNYPVLTWYSKAGRTELSGPVLSRWISKTLNFLDEEFPFGFSSFSVDMPASWRSAIWTISGWLHGNQLIVGDDHLVAELKISDELSKFDSKHADEGQVQVAQAQGLLDLRWPGSLPAGLLDGISVISSQADTLLNTVNPDDTSQIGLISGKPLLYEALFSKSSDTYPAFKNYDSFDANSRVLVKTKEPSIMFLQIFSLWKIGASAVIIDSPEVVDSEETVIRQEKVTETLSYFPPKA